MKSNKGFTLIELLVVSTIIVILSAIGLVSFTNAGRGARDSKRKADLETVRQAMVLFRSSSDTGAYPSGNYTTVINALVAGSYISSPTPQDPKSNTQSYEIGANGSGKACVCAGMEKVDNADSSGCNVSGGNLDNMYCLPTL